VDVGVKLTDLLRKRGERERKKEEKEGGAEREKVGENEQTDKLSIQITRENDFSYTCTYIYH